MEAEMRDAPSWLYEGLPYLYILGGLFAVVGMNFSVTNVSGALLVTAGLIIFRLRMHYRSRAAKRVLLRLAFLR
jgi:hypothetical protein